MSFMVEIVKNDYCCGVDMWCINKPLLPIKVENRG